MELPAALRGSFAPVHKKTLWSSNKGCAASIIWLLQPSAWTTHWKITHLWMCVCVDRRGDWLRGLSCSPTHTHVHTTKKRHVAVCTQGRGSQMVLSWGNETSSHKTGTLPVMHTRARTLPRPSEWFWSPAAYTDPHLIRSDLTSAF